MDIGALLTYYNSLFGIEIAIFSVISAVILVFIQLVYSNYSYKYVYLILKNRWLLCYWIVSIIDLLATSAGSYFLLFNSQKLVPGQYPSMILIISNPYYALFCMLLIFSSILIFAIFIIQNINYLQPQRAIFILSKSIHYYHIRDFLWKKFSLKAPNNLRVSFVWDISNDKQDIIETIEEKSTRKNKEEDKNEDELKQIEKIIRTIKEKVRMAEDPLLPIRDMMIQFKKRSDLSSIEEANHLLISISSDFYNKVPRVNDQVWMPENTLSLNYTQHLIETIETLLEISEKEQLESARKIILETSYQVALRLIEEEQYHVLGELEKFWKRIADDSIGKSSVLFQNIICYYKEVGDKIFNQVENRNSLNPSDEIISLLDNIFRHVGWLGERLLTKTSLEDSPLMMDNEYSTEYNDLYECLLFFSDVYDRRNPNLYPLIYFAYSDEIVHRFRLMSASKERSRTGKIIINQLDDMSKEQRSLL